MRLAPRPAVGSPECPPSSRPGPPSFRSYQPEVLLYARYLGMDPVRDKSLLWIAQQGIDAPLPPGWAEWTDSDGTAYYYHHPTQETTWTHPSDAHYWRLYRKLKARQKPPKKQAAPKHTPARPATSRRPDKAGAQESDQTRAATARSARTPHYAMPLRPVNRENSSAKGKMRASGKKEPEPKGYISAVLQLVRGERGAQPPEEKAQEAMEVSELLKPRPPSSRPKGREMSKMQRQKVLKAAFAEPRRSTLGPEDPIARPNIQQLWYPAPEKKFFVPEYHTKRKIVHKLKQRPVAEEEAEIDEVAALIIVPRVQLATLYKAFKRHAVSDQRFTEKEWGEMLSKIGIKRADVKQRMFKVWSRAHPPRRRFLHFKDATQALCALGVGDKQKQAQAIFQLCDMDKNGSLSRAELLSFAQDQHPLGSHLPRSEKSRLFIQVGKLFEILGASSSKDEISGELFVAQAVLDESVWEYLTQINPYTHYFEDWDAESTGMHNLLNALLMKADKEEHRASVEDRVLALARTIHDDGSGFIDADEILQALMSLGYQADEAEAIAKEKCGSKGMAVDDFVSTFTALAECNLKKFAQVEKGYGMARVASQQIL